MRKVRAFITVASLVVPFLAAGQGPPPQVSGPFGKRAAPRAVDRTTLGPQLTEGDLTGAATLPGCLVDTFGMAYDMTLTPDPASGPVYYVVTGTVDPGSGWAWIFSGWIRKKATGSFEYSWRLDNPRADGCNGGWVDYATIVATGAKFLPGGTFTSYCSSFPAYSEPAWTGSISKGACP